MFSHRTKDLICTAGLAPLPVVEVEDLATDTARIWIKREWDDPFGPDPLRTVKRKPACLLVADMVEKNYLGQGRAVISATTGNLGIEIGIIAASEGFPFFSVVPVEIPVQTLELLLTLGVNVVQTSGSESSPLESTVHRARGYATEFHHRLIGIDQYSNWLNPLAHASLTARELFEGFGQRIDYLVTPVGSCGTICGLQQYMLATGQTGKLVGVQPAGEHRIPGTHVVTGNGAWSPENFSPVVLERESISAVDGVEAYAFATKLWACGIPAGPSTGMALAKAYELVRDGAAGNLVVMSADSNFKYGDLIRYSLREMKADIVARFPELEIDDAIDAYAEEMTQAYGLGQTLQRVRQCYPIDGRGQLCDERDFYESVWADYRAPRALQRTAS